VKAMDTVVEIVTHTGDIFRKRFPQGSVYFQKSDGLRLVCCGEGKVAYLPAHVPTDVISPELLQGKFEPEEKLPFDAYIMDLRKGSLDGIDNLQSLIEVRLFPQQYIGQSEVPPAKLVLSRDRQDALPGTFQIPSQYFEAPKPNPPRLFVVRSDCSGCELLPFVRVEPFLRHAEDNTATIALPVSLLVFIRTEIPMPPQQNTSLLLINSLFRCSLRDRTGDNLKFLLL